MAMSDDIGWLVLVVWLVVWIYALYNQHKPFWFGYTHFWWSNEALTAEKREEESLERHSPAPAPSASDVDEK
jgi:hypothetical protein